jgi:uncharacterized protein (DUF58 family)
VLHIIRELLTFEPTSSRTDITSALQYFANAQKRRCTAFLISDFLDTQFLQTAKTGKKTDLEKAWMIASNKHDLQAIQIYDKRETELPNVGLLKLKDAETGERIWVDTAEKQVRDAYARAWFVAQQTLQDLFTKTHTDHVSVRTDEDYVKALKTLFRQ